MDSETPKTLKRAREAPPPLEAAPIDHAEELLRKKKARATLDEEIKHHQHIVDLQHVMKAHASNLQTNLERTKCIQEMRAMYLKCKPWFTIISTPSIFPTSSIESELLLKEEALKKQHKTLQLEHDKVKQELAALSRAA